MTRPRPGIGSELLPLSLILGCVALTLVLVVAMHRRAAVARKAPDAPRPVVVAPPIVEEPDEPPPPAPPPPPSPPVPRENPTPKAIAPIAAAEAVEREEAAKADRRTVALLAARQAALAESRRLVRRETLIRAQVDRLAGKTEALEREVDALALERDVLARERDTAKAALAKARTASSYAVLPHKGPNGTWRRPVVIECRNGTARVQPNGPTFTLLDLSGRMGMRASPVVVAVARELLRIEGSSSPDGAPVVPYIFFVVRPDGIRPYYEARARLEPLGIAFGYELVDQDWEVDFSDPDAPVEGDGNPSVVSTPRPPVAAPGGGAGALSWPAETSARRGAGAPANDSAESFVWPARPPGLAAGTSGGPIDEVGSGGTGRRPYPNGIGTTGRDLAREDGPGAESGGTGEGTAEGLSRPEGGRFGNAADSSGNRPNRAGEPPNGLGGSRSQSATERAFGQRPGLLPLSPGGLPQLESAGSGAGAASRDLSRPIGPKSNSRSLAASGRGENQGPLESSGSGAGPTDKGTSPPGDPQSGGRGQSVAGGGEDQGLSWPSSGTPGGASHPSRKPPSGRRPISAGDLEEDQGPDENSSEGSGSAGSGPRGKSGLKNGGGPRWIEPKKIEVPFEITVACGPNGVMIYPGGYRLSPKALKEPGLLAKELLAVAQLRTQVDPLIVPRPSLKFLIEPGGGDIYWGARRQLFVSRIDWPVSLQLGDTNLLGFTPGETRP